MIRDGKLGCFDAAPTHPPILTDIPRSTFIDLITVPVLNHLRKLVVLVTIEQVL